jgi:hypothetical protein
MTPPDKELLLSLQMTPNPQKPFCFTHDSTSIATFKVYKSRTKSCIPPSILPGLTRSQQIINLRTIYWSTDYLLKSSVTSEVWITLKLKPLITKWKFDYLLKSSVTSEVWISSLNRLWSLKLHLSSYIKSPQISAKLQSKYAETIVKSAAKPVSQKVTTPSHQVTTPSHQATSPSLSSLSSKSIESIQVNKISQPSVAKPKERNLSRHTTSKQNIQLKSH